MTGFGKKTKTGHKQKHTNCDLGMLYEYGKNKMSGQGVLDQAFFLNTNKNIRPQKTPPKKNPKCQTPLSQFIPCCGFGFAFYKASARKLTQTGLLE